MNKNQSKFQSFLLIKKSTTWVFFAIAFYKIVLDFCYYFVISKSWGYQGFLLKLNTFKLVESYFLCFIIFVLMPKSSRKLSSILIWLLILFSYVPVLTLYAMGDKSRFFAFYATFFWIIIFLLTKMPTLSFIPLNEKQAKAICYSFYVCLAFTAFFMWCKYSGRLFFYGIG